MNSVRRPVRRTIWYGAQPHTSILTDHVHVEARNQIWGIRNLFGIPTDTPELIRDEVEAA